MALATAATLDAEVGREGGPVISARITFEGDDSYPTGGSADFSDFVAAALGVKAGDLEVLAVIGQNLSDHELLYDKANDKLIVRVASTAAEVANTTDLSSTDFEALILAR
jgi:predicted CopG family antitoxin